MTKEEQNVYNKVLHVFAEFEYDCDADIEGCDGNELVEIEYALQTCKQLKVRLNNYLSGKVDNPRGHVNGEKAITEEPKCDS